MKSIIKAKSIKPESITAASYKRNKKPRQLIERLYLLQYHETLSFSFQLLYWIQNSDIWSPKRARSGNLLTAAAAARCALDFFHKAKSFGCFFSSTNVEAKAPKQAQMWRLWAIRSFRGLPPNLDAPFSIVSTPNFAVPSACRDQHFSFWSPKTLLSADLKHEIWTNKYVETWKCC